MGKISQGILGGFSGKVGNVVGGKWKGVDYMRVKASNVTNPKTEGQLAQRGKFQTVLGFLQPNIEFVKAGFKNEASKMTEFNCAMSYNLKNAVTGDHPDYSIDYSKALLSKGTLATAAGTAIASTESGKVNFTWSDNSTDYNANGTDKAMLLVYIPTLQQAIAVTDGEARTVGSIDINLPANFVGQSVECFIAFKTADGTKVSNSVYIGSVVVA